MARTVWGAHKRYMDTYLNVYKGYYVRTTTLMDMNLPLTFSSSRVMEQDVITKVTTGSEVVSMMWSMFPVIVCLPPKLRLP